MLNLLFIRNPNQPRIISEVRCLSSCFPLASFCGTSLASSFSSGDTISEALGDLSSVDSSSISKSGKIGRFLGLLGGKERKSPHGSGSSLKDLLLGLSDIVPDISRRFRRYPSLSPENVLELLLGFESQFQKAGIGSTKVGALWEIFRWAGGQYKGFKHLRQSCEIMASMLMREQMVKEVELLLMEMGSLGDTLYNPEIFSNLIEKYVTAFDSERAVLLYYWMRNQDLVPSNWCHQLLIDHLVQVRKTESAYGVCLDWVEMMAVSNSMKMLESSKVIELLCLDGRVQEARSLVRKLVALGCELSSSAFKMITSGYCEKQDFEDLLSFISESKYAPDVFVGNRILHVMCRKFGSERANVFMEELQHLGFKPNEVTLGILIGWSCYELNISRAFLYLSDIVSKGLKPRVFSYNAILGGLFRKGLWEHAHHILDDMTDNGILPNMLTFKILIAGYCKARQFKDAKIMIHKMSGYGLVEASAVEDPLSQAFILLGLDPLAVRLKRDNHAGLPRTEFLDDLGNGLYLDTDLDYYEKRVSTVLYSSALPNFSSLIVRACDSGNFRSALELLDEMVRWGQELSCQGFAFLMKGLCASHAHVRVSASLFGKWPKLANQLDGETLNFLAQEYCKKGLTRQARLILHRMVHMHLPVNRKTYTLLINSFCKKGMDHQLLKLWAIAHKDNWLPDLDNCGTLWECLILKGMLKEALELFERMFGSYPFSQSETRSIFLEKLSMLGFSSVAHSFLVYFEERGYILDQDVYSHVIRGLCKDKNVSAAIAVLGCMLGKNYIPSLDAFLMLIPRLCRANETVKAISLADLCLKTHSSGSSSVYHALIDGLCSVGKIRAAENQFHRMLLDGPLPDIDIYNFMFQGYCHDNNWRKIQEALGILVRKNISFLITSYRKYVQKMCLEGQISRAVSLNTVFLLGQNNSHSLIAYNLLIFYLFGAKNHLLVNRVLQEMQAKGLLPDEVTHNFLIHGFSSCRDLSSALHHLSCMISKGFRPNNRSLRLVISSLCDTGEVKKAMDLCWLMQSRGWFHGSVVQNKIAEALISRGKIQEAEEFLIRVMQKGLTPDTINYDNLIRKMCCFGKLDMAVHLLNTMLKKQSIPSSSSYDSVVHGFLKCDHLDKAMDFHLEMLDHGLNPTVSSWSILAHKFCEMGEAGEAEKIIKSMVQLGETPTKDMYTAIINQYRIKSNAEKESEIIQMMQQSGYKPDFETHWSLISNLRSSKAKVTTSNSQGFLSRLLSGNGSFDVKK